MRNLQIGWARKKNIWAFLFIVPVLVYFVLVFYIPLFRVCVMSFQKVTLTGEIEFAGLSLYIKILRDPSFWASFRIIFYYLVIFLPFTIVTSIIIASLLNEVLNKSVRNLLTLLYILPLGVSFVAAALMWCWLLEPTYGLVNYILSLMHLPTQPWLTSCSQVIPSLAIVRYWVRAGFCIIILLAGLQNIPKEYYEAAKIDGATGLKSFSHITLPLLRPQIVLVGIIETILGMRAFDEAWVLTKGGPAGASRTPMIYLYQKAFVSFKFGEASVVSVLFVGVLLILSILQWRFVRGAKYEI